MLGDVKIDGETLESLGVELIVVFGSRARGRSRPNSDLDVGVLFAPHTQPNPPLLDEVRRTLEDGEDLDLVCLNGADPLLLREVALDGVPRFVNREGVFEEFRLVAFKLFIDTEKFRRFELERLRASLG